MNADYRQSLLGILARLDQLSTDADAILRIRWTPTKLRAKDRPLKNDAVSDEEFKRLLSAWFSNIARVRSIGSRGRRVPHERSQQPAQSAHISDETNQRKTRRLVKNQYVANHVDVGASTSRKARSTNIRTWTVRLWLALMVPPFT